MIIGDNEWLDCRNKKGEYSIVYLGINNSFNNQNKMIEDLSDFSQNLNNAEIK